MKKKRKIKIPAAAYGTATNSEMTGLVAYNNGVAYNPLQSSINSAPTPSIPNMPTKGMGTGMNMGNMVGMAGDAIDLLSNPFKKSTATSGGEAAVQSVANVGKGAAMGFTVGGPIGAIVGAGIGAIGSKGEEASMQSFTDYDEGTLGTGIIGAFGNKRLRRERNRIKVNAYNNRAAVQGTNDLENRYAMDYGYLDTNAFAQGGAVPSSLAYVDDGELIQTPDGSVNQVPEKGQPLDNNLVQLPEGSRILSNTLKVPGTKKTFSELGEKMMTKRRSKGKDKFAENSNMLNERNNQMIYDQLFAMQEQVKANRGIKDKTKNLEAFQDGGIKSRKNTLRVQDTIYNLGDVFDYNGKKFKVTGTNEAKVVPQTITSYDSPIGPEPFREVPMNYLYNVGSMLNRSVQPREVPSLDYVNEDVNISTTQIPQYNTASSTAKSTNNAVRPINRTTVKPNVTNRSVVVPELSTDILDPIVDENIDLQPTIGDIRTRQYIPRTNNTSNTGDQNDTNTDYNISELLSDIATISPIMSNLFAKNERPVDAIYNPYANAITRTMSGRSFNIDPAIEDITRNRAISNYNAGQMNTNTGANLAYRLQSAVNTDRAIAGLRSQESNVNNQYLGDYANTMNSLGQQYVAATNLANETNAANRATTRNIRRTGLSQLSQYGQNRQLMRNQRNRDNAMMELYAPFLQAGFTKQDMVDFNKYLRKGGNYVG